MLAIGKALCIRRYDGDCKNEPFAFREWAREQEKPYSILAVKAPVEDLVAKLQGLFQIHSHQPNVALTGKLSDLPGVPVVKFKDTPWCVVYWSIGYSSLLENDCRRLSRQLSTQALIVNERESSECVEWFLFEEDEDLERVEWYEYDDSIGFDSSQRREPDLDNISPDKRLAKLDDLLLNFLSDQKIYFPAFNINLDSTFIEQVDLLLLPHLPLGVKEFRDWIGHPDYSILAVQAPIEQVGQTLASQPYEENWQKQIQSDKRIYNVADRLYGESLKKQSRGDSWWIPILQPTANPWTVVYWCVGGRCQDMWDMCQDLSSLLQARVITFQEQDTSGWLGYFIYEQGQEIEGASWMPGSEFGFRSQTREEPEFDNFEEDERDVIEQFIDETFAQEGVYIPAWSRKVSDPCLERVDFILRS